MGGVLVTNNEKGLVLVLQSITLDGVIGFPTVLKSGKISLINCLMFWKPDNWPWRLKGTIPNLPKKIMITEGELLFFCNLESIKSGEGKNFHFTIGWKKFKAARRSSNKSSNIIFLYHYIYQGVIR